LGTPFVFRLPREIFFGSGQGNDTGNLVKDIGGKALIVTGRKAVREHGILNQITTSLDRAGVLYSIFDEVEPEPSLTTVDRAIDCGFSAKCDMVLSIGGGSALDCGKAVACLLGKERSIRPYFYGARLVQPGVPWVALPTTAGTGSEMTSNSVLTDYELNFKKSVRSPFLVARMVIIDPLFTLSMNPYVTAVSGIDALVQGIEAFTSPHSNPVSGVLALEAVELLWRYLPEVVRNGKDVQSREFVAKGSMMSAMAFANSSSGAAHGFSHLIGPEFSIPHGEACGLLLPHIIRYNHEVFFAKYLQLVQRLGLEENNGHYPAELLASAFEDLLRRVGLRMKLRDFQVQKNQLETVLREDNIGKNITENPRPFRREDMIELLKSAW